MSSHVDFGSFTGKTVPTASYKNPLADLFWQRFRRGLVSKPSGGSIYWYKVICTNPTHNIIGFVYSTPHKTSPQFKNFIRQAYLYRTMTEWGKTKHKTFTVSAWGKSGWVKHDPVKVLGHTTLIKQKPRPSLEVSSHPAKKSLSSKICTKFDNLLSETLHNIEEWHFSLLYHKKFKKSLTQITQNNPLLRSTRS